MAEGEGNAIGIIGGSGLYDIAGFEDREDLSVSTPFGDPSDRVVGGRLAEPTLAPRLNPLAEFETHFPAGSTLDGPGRSCQDVAELGAC